MTTQPMIIKLLGIAPENYAQTVFETAEAFLKMHFSSNELVYPAFKSESFWKWWKYQWNRRNTELLYRYRVAIEQGQPSPGIVREMRQDHDYLHQLDQLVIHPSPEVFDTAYEQLVQGIIKETKKQKAC